MYKRIILIFLLASIIIVGLAIFFCNKIVKDTAKGKTYSDLQSIPYNKVGLLLGTSKYLANGKINLYYKYRIDAAFNLLKANKIKYLIISGDNGHAYYNEPITMRKDLIDNGIDSNKIYLDYAGFRTFDSIVRLKDIFGQDSVTIISQQFHNERAIYIASKEGISAIAFNAEDVHNSGTFKMQVREKLARVKLFLDYIFGKQPKFLGNKINIPG